MGVGAKATGNKSISIGTGNEVSGQGSGAIGDPTEIIGNESYSLGNDNNISADYAGVFGNDNIIAWGADGSRIIGNNSIDVADAFVLGNNADVTKQGGVAIGSSSVSDRDAGVAGFNPATGAAGDQNRAIAATKSTTGAVAVGDANKKVFRQIAGVAAGTEDGDAVNVSQLKAVSDVASAGWNLTTNGDANSSTKVAPYASVDFSSSDGNIKITNEGLNVKLALADDIEINNSIKVGDTKIDSFGLTIEGGPSVTKDGIDAGGKVIAGIAPDEVSETSTEAINGSQLYTIGQVANAGWNLSVCGGDLDNIAPNDTLNVVDGTNTVATYDAAKKELAVSMVDNPTFAGEVTMDGGMSVGLGQKVDMGGNVISNVGAGVADTDGVNVAQLNEAANRWVTAEQTTEDYIPPVATGKGSTAIGSGAIASGTNSVAIGVNSSDEGRDNVVSVGSAGNERQITNVAAGKKPTDAVNVSQLDALGAALHNHINKVGKRASAGTASAMASGNLLQATIPGKGMASMSGGYYDGQSAVAFGISKMSDNGKWVVKAGGTIDSQDKVGVSAAVGFHF